MPASRYARQVRVLLDALKSTCTRPKQLAITAKLLSILLNVPLNQVLGLRHSDLDLKEFRSLRIGQDWVQLPGDLFPILKQLPSDEWRTGIDQDPPLFEGRMLVDKLSVSAVEYHVAPVLKVGRLKTSL